MLISACLLLTGCDGNETYTIPAQDRPYFKNGDTLLFKDVSGVVDTLVVTVIQGFEQHDKGDSFENLVFRYQLFKNKVIDNRDLLHAAQSPNGVGIVSSKGISFSKNKSIDQIQLRDGTVIKRVSEFGRSPNMITDADVELIYFAPYYGVVKYKYHSGAVFELVLP